MLEKADRWLLVAVIIAICVVVSINFTTSYTHLYMLSIHLGDGGTNARLTPVGIDSMLLALGIANVFAARLRRPSKWLRAGLGFGVGGTILANGAYGAWHGYSGIELSVWSPIALFITVEAGLYMFKIAAEHIAAQADPANAEESEAAAKLAEIRRKRSEASKRSKQRRLERERGEVTPAATRSASVENGQPDVVMDAFAAR